jgi:RTC4-like domain
VLARDSECTFAGFNISRKHLSSYGEKGCRIIQDTLRSLLPVEYTCATHFSPLTLPFITLYILVPHIGATLISQDCGISIEDAYQVMQESADCGYSLHPDDAGLDSILQQNACAGGKSLHTVSPTTTYYAPTEMHVAIGAPPNSTPQKCYYNFTTIMKSEMPAPLHCMLQTPSWYF